MQKIILFDPVDNTYNILNITNQTSTKWWNTLEEAIEYDKVSNRRLDNHWGLVSGKSLEDAIDVVKLRHARFRIFEIIDEEQPYEYW